MLHILEVQFLGENRMLQGSTDPGRERIPGSCHQMGASNDDLVSNLEYLLLLCFSPRPSFEIWCTFKV